MQPRSAPTVRFSSTAAYSHHTVPSTAAHTPTTPVHRHLKLRVPLVSAPPRPPCRLKYTRHTIDLTTTPSHSSTHTSSLRRRSRGLLAVPATSCYTPWGRRTRGRRVKHPCPTLMHGGGTAHHQAGTTCHIALAVILRLPEPHNQAMRALLLRRHPLRCVQRGDGGRCTHISHTLSICVTPGPHHVITISSVMPQPEYPRVALQSRPP